MKPENQLPSQDPITSDDVGSSRLAPGNLVSPVPPSSFNPGSAAVPASISPSANQPPSFPQTSQVPPIVGPQLPINPKPPRQWKKLAFIPAGLLSLAVVAASAWFLLLKPDSPDAVFKKSLENALSTKSIQIEMKEGSGNYTLTTVTKIDTSDVTNPKSSSVITDEYNGEKSTSEFYSTSKDAFFKIADTGLYGLSELSSVSGKWVQAQKDGQSPGVDTYSALSYTGSYSWSFFGYFINGNFESDQKKEFTDFLLENEVYDYNADRVKTRTVDGKKQLVYDVDVSEEDLKEFNKQVAKSIDVDERKVEENYVLSSSDIKIDFYIDPKQKRVTKVKINDSGISMEVKFTGFNSTTVPPAPKPEVSYEDYVKLIDQQYDGLDDESGSPADIERKTDINALHGQIEAYYAQYGSYPALAEVNNAAWRAVNMKGLDPSALQDPAGTVQQLAAVPSAVQYGYAVFQDDGVTACTTDAGDCVVYTLNADLTNGDTYTKQSLN